MKLKHFGAWAPALTAAAMMAGAVHADPCGMVPPLWTMNVPQAITRIGVQRTYVFHRQGMESFVIRPEFKGKVDEFGMLIPFPSPPSIRKVPDDIFAHFASAAEPPEVRLNVASRRRRLLPKPSMAARSGVGARKKVKKLQFDEVRVLNQEAVGMYEVAVLEAGSASALKRWMEDHHYRYPKGMEDTTNEYVADGWCFVAVKTRVGKKAGVDPKPGMRAVDAQLPKGATFDGAVQAMGFRFKSKKLVVPMRLSAFNEGELRNVVFLLSEHPMKIRQFPASMVRRQIPGKDLIRNLNGLLPVRVVGGPISRVTPQHLKTIAPQRDPKPHNGFAREVFSSDIRASRRNQLINPHEEAEKALLNIGEALNLRGKEIDALNRKAIEEKRTQVYKGTLNALRKMTLTVIDGDFPRKIVARENLRFEKFALASEANTQEKYDPKSLGPRPQGTKSAVFWGTPKHLVVKKNWWNLW